MAESQIQSDIEDGKPTRPTSDELTDEKVADEIRSKLLGDKDNKNIIRSMN